MKYSTLLGVGTALLLVCTVGCRKTAPKTTPLPGGGAGATTSRDDSSPRKQQDLSTSPVPTTGGTTGAGVAGANVPTDLPDDSTLADRDQDRAKFAAQTVYFDFDRSSIKQGDASKVAQVIEQFKALPPGHDLLIEGHCDERGTEGYNQALGERRALAVRELLTQGGIDGQHVFTKSLGKDQPAVDGHDESAWSRNRRGEFILVLPKKITTTQTQQ